jgi:hypothetical protein
MTKETVHHPPGLVNTPTAKLFPSPQSVRSRAVPSSGSRLAATHDVERLRARRRAHRAGLMVLHYDANYERIAKLTGQRVQ